MTSHTPARSRYGRVSSVLALLAALTGPGVVLSASTEAPAPPAAATALDPVEALHAERPTLWLDARGRPTEASRRLLARARSAADDGLDPARYDLAAVQARLDAARHGRTEAAAAERRLSRLFLALTDDLATPRPENALHVADAAALPGPPPPGLRLRQLAESPDPARAVDAALARHPLYEDLRRALAALRAAGGDPATERLILANLDRVRALPADPGPLYVLVDVAAAGVRVVEAGRERLAMRAVVGEARHPTPAMAGMLRHAIYAPYWNVPEDLAQTRVAAAVLRQGPAYLKARDMEVLSDWTPAARPINPATVDWRAAVERRLSVRVRQKPGPGNMLGGVKFMLPNTLGIYLHDTPERDLFARDVRALSAGCVRLEEPEALARALFGGPLPAIPAGAAEHRVDLPRAVPIYLVYLTAVAKADGTLERRPDVYGRDGSLGL